MEKTVRFAEIPQVKGGVAFSDPLYSSDIWCCYQKAFGPASGWVMKVESTCDEDGFVEFALFLGHRSMMSRVRIDEEEGAIRYGGSYCLETREVGCDTARVYIGGLDAFYEWGEEASIYTAADGLFGDLYIFTKKGEEDPEGFLLMGSIDGGITDEEELFRTVVAAFEGHEISRERFEKITATRII